ncbi:ankyrin repeat-containing protein BDA1-like [Mercurialis annua]|uniref:ankyrin repeat-containing protein BDA1-like n=1 Tax=Mercurialis annua TaxID=3986 RepID=UPI00215F3FBD|nr:ankyrin repeat-containing protein BDA1-like [Mercurialis annua]
MDANLVRVKGREGLTPFHYAVAKGHVFLLEKFLSVCLKAVEDVTIQNESALHIALRNNQFDAFQFLVGRLCWDCHEKARGLEKRILNLKDVEHNTVLHIATSKNQLQLVNLLLRSSIDINAKNVRNQTALDIAEEENLPEITHLLRRAQAARASSLHTNVNLVSLRIDQRLKLAAEQGDVDTLYSIITDDPYLLEHIDQSPFIHTPLHVAASNGRTQFALEIARLRPSMARKLNQDGFSPMHLALQNGHIQTVCRFVDMDNELVRFKGRAGQTPLHYIAGKGKFGLLTKFLQACPKSVRDLNIYKETVLHIAAKNGMWETFRVLSGWLQITGQDDVLNWPDDDGNTVLHIAASRNQSQIVKLLIGRVDMNVINLEGHTAMDIIKSTQTNPTEMYKILSCSGAVKASQIPTSFSLVQALKKPMLPLEKWALARYREKLSMSDENRNAVLVVAVLIATATYQAVLSPPGGVWQGDPTLLFPQINDTLLNNNSLTYVGSPVMFYLAQSVWLTFSVLNTVTFFISMAVIYYLLPQRPLIVLPLVIPLLLCYEVSWYVMQMQSDGVILFSSVIAAEFISMFLWGFVAGIQKKWRTVAHLMADKVDRQS